MRTEEKLSLREAADALGISEVNARRWVKSGKLRAYKPGRKYLIPVSAIEELLGVSNNPKAQTLPVDIDHFKMAAIEEAKPESPRELQAMVEERIEETYSTTQLLTLKDELAEIRASLAPNKETHFDAYARVVEAENYVRRVLERTAGRVK